MNEMEGDIIKKSNALIEASYRLSVQEQRIFLACLAQVRSDEVITDQKVYEIHTQDIINLCGSNAKSSYSDIKKAALKLRKRDVLITEYPNGEGSTPEVLVASWVQSIRYVDKEGTVKLRFCTDMIPYINNLSKEFTQYALSDVAKMDSAHAIRLFELLMQWKTKGELKISVDEFKNSLQIEGKYSRIKDFKNRVLLPAVQQINEHSPLNVEWEQLTRGRKITHFVFYFTMKNPKQKNTKALKDIAHLAKPGETWEELKARLKREKQKA
jgi:plasmid replication initiation protein